MSWLSGGLLLMTVLLVIATEVVAHRKSKRRAQMWQQHADDLRKAWGLEEDR
jgi:hypothetical protein